LKLRVCVKAVSSLYVHEEQKCLSINFIRNHATSKLCFAFSLTLNKRGNSYSIDESVFGHSAGGSFHQTGS